LGEEKEARGNEKKLGKRTMTTDKPSTKRSSQGGGENTGAEPAKRSGGHPVKWPKGSQKQAQKKKKKMPTKSGGEEARKKRKELRSPIERRQTKSIGRARRLRRPQARSGVREKTNSSERSFKRKGRGGHNIKNLSQLVRRGGGGKRVKGPSFSKKKDIFIKQIEATCTKNDINGKKREKVC